jgi:hypothetical protein
MSSSICLTLVLIFAVVLFLLDRRLARLERNVAQLNGCEAQQPAADNQVNIAA